MATAVIMPKVGISVESCIITQWHKREGEEVRKGDLLFSYETDKATAEEEAKEDGILLKILAAEGDEVAVLANVCVLGAAGEDVSAFAAQTAEGETAQNAPQANAEPDTLVGAPAAVIMDEGSSTKVSPRARTLARKLGVDAAHLRGTGPQGRVIERDVRAAADSGLRFTGAALSAGARPVAEGTGIGGRITAADVQSAPVQTSGAVRTERLSGVRRAIAKSMTQSLGSMAQLTNHTSFAATNLLRCRANLKQSNDPAQAGITLNDLILHAVACVLKHHPALNAHLVGEEMQYYNDVHLGMAVDTPRGLLVPTIFGADALALPDLSAQAKRLAKEAQEGTIPPDALRGGTFTVTNLGALGVEMFTPVINPPQTGILGVCAIVERVRMVNGAVQTYPAMGLSLTYDHRAVDGAPAARFLMELKELLENFEM